MEQHALPATDLRVSRIALGCWQFAGDFNWGVQEERRSLDAVAAALDHGINLFDNAEAYGDGQSEEVLGRALKGRRWEAVIASKTRAETPEALVQQCEHSLRRLRTEVIDLYQLHWPPREGAADPLLEAMERLRREGKIRAHGVCNFGVRDLEGVRPTGEGGPVTDQLPYSLLWRAIEDEVLPAAVERGMGVLAYSPLMQALLTGKYASAEEVPDGRARTRHFSSERPLARHAEAGQEELTFATLRRIDQVCRDLGEPMHRVAVAWLLRRPGVTSVIVGGRDAEQVAEAARGAALRLDEVAVQRLDEATEALKRALGSNPDMWQSDSRIH